MPWIVKYDTIITNAPLNEPQLKSFGERGWSLGGVAQTTEAVAGFGIADPTLRRDVYHYHFWQRVYRWSDGTESQPRRP